MKNKLKKIGAIALDVVIVIAFIVSVFIIIANISAKNAGGHPNLFGYVFSSVQTDSMSGTIEPGDLVVGKIPDKDTVIKENDIISFNAKVNGYDVIVTHRVYKVEDISGTPVYTTWGDNRERCPEPDAEPKSINDVVAVHAFTIPFMGKIIDFLKSPLGFVICLLLPLLAFVGFQVYKLISLYLQHKKELMIQEAKDGVSDEAKDAIIREYLAKMQQENGENQKSDDAPNKSTDGE